MTAHYIVPPYLIEHLERTAPDPSLRARYRQSLQHDAVLRPRPAPTQRATQEAQQAPAAGSPKREVCDAENGTDLPGRQVRAEGEQPVQDAVVNEAYDGTGATWKMYKECFGRDSVDNAGLPLISSVHYDRDYANAFWDGSQMVFGDGDGAIFKGFTTSIDVSGHELTHGVTQHTANLTYEGQSGALNESISDVFGSLAKQHHLGQTAAEADWVIGADLFQPGVNGIGLRSMKAPGTAYDDPRLGKDPQPAHMDDFVTTTEDSGGVHINSGIPNRAFYLAAIELGGNAYGDPGKIWYQALTSGQLNANATFADFAQATRDAATALYGANSGQLAAVTKAWQQVGVEPVQQPLESADLMRAANLALDPSRLPTPSPPTQPGGPGAEPAVVPDQGVRESRPGPGHGDRPGMDR
ncbi:MAG TPA: M4 family metallopeptidase [Kribbella sp.]|jgi:Zn-dependent metalloprotease